MAYASIVGEKHRTMARLRWNVGKGTEKIRGEAPMELSLVARFNDQNPARQFEKFFVQHSIGKK